MSRSVILSSISNEYGDAVNKDTYRAAMDVIKDSGDNALSDVLKLVANLKKTEHHQLQQTWQNIAKAIEEIQGQKTAQ